MHANFGEDRLMGFGVARGRFFWLFQLASSPLQHSRTIPCECDPYDWSLTCTVCLKHDWKELTLLLILYQYQNKCQFLSVVF